MTARQAPTVAELMALTQVICDACDGCGWTEGGTDFVLGQVCARCNGKGVVRDPTSAYVIGVDLGGTDRTASFEVDPARRSEWDAATGTFDQEGRR